jgi:CBS domain containing-hemolysin-like protein
VTPDVLLLIVCIGSIALFEGTEIALVASDRFRLRSLAKTRHFPVELPLDILKRREKVLVSLLVANTLVSTAAAALATTVVRAWMAPGTSAATTAMVTTGGLTLIVLLFGQVVPKDFARSRAEQVLVAAARPLFALDLLFLPVSWLVGFLVNLAVKLFGGRPDAVVTREELKILVQEVHGETGPLRQEKRMLQSILDFGQTTTREVMVPMPSVVSIEREASVEMLRTMLRRRGYTRIPVFERRVDRVVGVVHAFDALMADDGSLPIETFMRPITLVPETKRIDRLMAEMQRRGESMVVVVNEFGSCAGIVTMEDIVEEIMGEMADEHEVGVKRIRSLGEGTYIVAAMTDIDDLNEELSLDLPKLRYDTVGGLVMRKLGRIPQEGERFEVSGVEFEVVEVYPYGVRTVKLTLPAAQREET